MKIGSSSFINYISIIIYYLTHLKKHNWTLRYCRWLMPEYLEGVWAVRKDLRLDDCNFLYAYYIDFFIELNNKNWDLIPILSCASNENCITLFAIYYEMLLWGMKKYETSSLNCYERIIPSNWVSFLYLIFYLLS